MTANQYSYLLPLSDSKQSQHILLELIQRKTETNKYRERDGSSERERRRPTIGRRTAGEAVREMSVRGKSFLIGVTKTLNLK